MTANKGGIKMTKAELVKLLKENFYSETYDIIDLSELKFDCSVLISKMEVKGNLYQYKHKVDGNLHQGSHEVGGNLSQHNHEVGGNLSQSYHEVKGNLYQHSHNVGGRITEGNHKKLLKKITREELAKLGYMLED